jgi:phage terminase small subunit
MTDLTPKQEKFCRKYIELGNASEAYRQSYDAGKMKPEVIHVKACELLKNGNVKVRVEELQAKHQKRHDVTMDSLTSEYEEARVLALADKQYSPVISAITGKAKLHGLLIDKAETKLTFENMTDEQLNAAIRQFATEAGLGVADAGSCKAKE